MWGIFEYVLIFLLFQLKISASEANNVSEAFHKFGVVPDMIPVAPSALVKVVYLGNVEVLLGNKLQPTQTFIAPTVDWEADLNSFYTLALVGDAPLPGQFLHWLVGNIPGRDVSRGQTLAPFLPSTPLPAFGRFRYVVLIYKQSDRMKFNTSLLEFALMQLRVNFFINKFAVKNNLGNPVFGNFFQEQVLPLRLL